VVADAADARVGAVVVARVTGAPCTDTVVVSETVIADAAAAEIRAAHDGVAAVKTTRPIEASSLIAEPEAVVKALLTAVTVTVAPAVVVRVPTDAVAAVVKPSHAVAAVAPLVTREGKPDPPVGDVMAPIAVVVRHPAPRIVGHPGPAVSVAVRIPRPDPLAVLVRDPFFFVRVRDEVTGTFDDHPTALAGERGFGLERSAVIDGGIRHDFGGRRVRRVGVLAVEQDDLVLRGIRAIGGQDTDGDCLSREVVRDVEGDTVFVDFKIGGSEARGALGSVALIGSGIICAPDKILDVLLEGVEGAVRVFGKDVGGKLDHVAGLDVDLLEMGSFIVAIDRGDADDVGIGRGSRKHGQCRERHERAGSPSRLSRIVGGHLRLL
jgi:hypothetical protein